VKAAIVGRDEHEVGERALLNFGHTIGHALEMGDGIGTRTHGEAVALGMVAALQIGEALGVTPASVVARTVSLLDRLGLPTRLDREALRRALPLVGFDKKRRGELLRFVVLREIGAAELRQVEAAALPRLLAPLLDA
jgi:3-dehydroquinate synthetase